MAKIKTLKDSKDETIYPVTVSEAFLDVNGNPIIPQIEEKINGIKGADGVTPNIQIGTVETMEAGSDATASITGTAENPLLNLGIPKGADGTPGKSAYQYARDGGYAGTEAEFAVKMAQEIPIVDDTLKIPGQAADAAVVGEQLCNLSEEIANLGTIAGNIPSNTETFTFTLEDGTEVVKEVYVKT